MFTLLQSLVRINTGKEHSDDEGGMVVVFNILNGCCNTTGVNSCNAFESATERNERPILRTMGIILILSYLMHVLGLVGQNKVAVKPYQLVPGGCFLRLWDGQAVSVLGAAAALRAVDS